MAQRPGNKRHPCHCRKGCPGIFVPYLNYRIKAPDSNFPAYHEWKLLKFSFENMDNLCLWLPAEPEPSVPPVTFIQDFRKTPGVGDDYQWAMILQDLPNVETYILDVEWDEDDTITSGENPACDQLIMELDDAALDKQCAIQAVPEWMCTDLDVENWEGP